MVLLFKMKGMKQKERKEQGKNVSLAFRKFISTEVEKSLPIYIYIYIYTDTHTHTHICIILLYRYPKTS